MEEKTSALRAFNYQKKWRIFLYYYEHPEIKFNSTIKVLNFENYI